MYMDLPGLSNCYKVSRNVVVCTAVRYPGMYHIFSNVKLKAWIRSSTDMMP